MRVSICLSVTTSGRDDLQGHLCFLSLPARHCSPSPTFTVAMLPFEGPGQWVVPVHLSPSPKAIKGNPPCFGTRRKPRGQGAAPHHLVCRGLGQPEPSLAEDAAEGGEVARQEEGEEEQQQQQQPEFLGEVLAVLILAHLPEHFCPFHTSL